jgi:archaellin
MNSHFDSSSSGIARVISVLVAFVMTAALFSAVVMGLTGEEGSLLAQGGDTTIVQA